MTARISRRAWLAASTALAFAAPAAAQTANASAPAAPAAGIEEIVVTAQRSAQSLQDVPIAVSAFTAEGLERQQLNNTSQLQLALPNITFTKSNFTGANLTIRGIGSPAVATSGDLGVGIHYNEAPIQGPLIFETEFFDLERIEVLRGPQGTQFGRNATGGVMDFITAKPVMGELQGRVEGEYGNYNSIRGFGMLNVPLGDKVAVRIAGQYVKRDGYTLNLYDGQRFDNRDQGAVRASLRFRPTDRTTIDLIGYYFSENDQRMRIQKQACLTDPTGILGCQPDGLAINQAVNPNATLGNIVQSREFAGVALGAAAIPFGNLSLYQNLPQGVNPNDVRQVNTNFTPSYRAREKYAQFKLNQDLDSFNLNITGSYHESNVRSRQDYNNITSPGPGQNAALRALFPNTANRLYSGSNYCISNPSRNYAGIYGGDTLGCFRDATQFDQSSGSSMTWSAEAVLRSQFEGRFNFLVGGIYLNSRADSDYFVVSNGLDYGSGLLGALQSGGTAFSASPFFNSETNRFYLKSYGIFGEAYVNFTDNLKLTVGARYSDDKKTVQDRNYLFNTLVPLGTVNAAPILGSRVDSDPVAPGINAYRNAALSSNAVTGRVVLDWKPTVSFTDDTLIYVSYSRGYKPGGINPPFDPAQFSAPVTFLPEYINAFEVGTKNRFRGGMFQANLTGFYYDYKNLQISRIINRTSFNDNTNATVWGVEGEFIVAPTRNWLFNINASYLKTRVRGLSLVDVRDPSGGRADTVIIKDITNASNCVVTPAATLPAGAAANFVNGFNSAFGGLVRPTVPVPGTNAVGAYGVCSALAGAIASAPAPLAAAFGVPAGGRLPFLLDPSSRVPALPAGNPVNLDGNELQNSPRVKANFGGQYTADIGTNGMTAVFRGDINFVGQQWGRNYNRPIDRIDAYETINLSVQLNGPDERWYVRGFIQNLTNNQGITGQYTTDPSSGLFTNIFTLEPRRFGGVVGVRF